MLRFSFAKFPHTAKVRYKCAFVPSDFSVYVHAHSRGYFSNTTVTRRRQHFLWVMYYSKCFINISYFSRPINLMRMRKQMRKLKPRHRYFAGKHANTWQRQEVNTGGLAKPWWFGLALCTTSHSSAQIHTMRGPGCFPRMWMHRPRY